MGMYKAETRKAGDDLANTVENITTALIDIRTKTVRLFDMSSSPDKSPPYVLTLLNEAITGKTMAVEMTPAADAAKLASSNTNSFMSATKNKYAEIRAQAEAKEAANESIKQFGTDNKNTSGGLSNR